MPSGATLHTCGSVSRKRAAVRDEMSATDAGSRPLQALALRVPSAVVPSCLICGDHLTPHTSHSWPPNSANAREKPPFPAHPRYYMMLKLMVLAAAIVLALRYLGLM